MSKTSKGRSEMPGMKVLQTAFNEGDASLTTSGFLNAKVGHRVTLAISTTNVADDTETYSFYDETVLLYQIRLIYTSAARSTLISAERIA
jgi:hypothetical protein